MVFKSKKGSYFTTSIFLFILLLVGKVIFKIINSPIDLNHFISDIVHFLLLGFLLWIYFDTKYELTQTEFKYKSGPIKGKNKLNEIQTVEIKKHLLSGSNFATAFNGLTISFKDGKRIYISPENNAIFLKELIILNGEIEIR